jgi:hypothetical protein
VRGAQGGKQKSSTTKVVATLGTPGRSPNNRKVNMSTVQATEAEAKKVAELLGNMFHMDPPKVMFNTWKDGRTMVVTEELPWEWHNYWIEDRQDNPAGVWVEPYNNGIASVWKEV